MRGFSYFQESIVPKIVYILSTFSYLFLRYKLKNNNFRKFTIKYFCTSTQSANLCKPSLARRLTQPHSHIRSLEFSPGAHALSLLSALKLHYTL